MVGGARQKPSRISDRPLAQPKLGPLKMKGLGGINFQTNDVEQAQKLLDRMASKMKCYSKPYDERSQSPKLSKA